MLAKEEIENLQYKIANGNDQNAFGQLYIAFMPSLVQFAQSILKNKELAEEVVSDVFIKIWQNRTNILNIANFKLYLYVSTKNTSFNYLSRHFRKEVVSLDEMSLPISSISYNPEEMMITSEVINRINAAISMLPPRCKLIFKLVKEDGLRYNEIADLLNISVKTIDNQMAIAVKKIGNAINFDLKTELRLPPHK
jgi:RNA polymerase sigma-70 factor (ECF subfamily)